MFVEPVTNAPQCNQLQFPYKRKAEDIKMEE